MNTHNTDSPTISTTEPQSFNISIFEDGGGGNTITPVPNSFETTLGLIEDLIFKRVQQQQPQPPLQPNSQKTHLLVLDPSITLNDIRKYYIPEIGDITTCVHTDPTLLKVNEGVPESELTFLPKSVVVVESTAPVVTLPSLSLLRTYLDSRVKKYRTKSRTEWKQILINESDAEIRQLVIQTLTRFKKVYGGADTHIPDVIAQYMQYATVKSV